MAKKTNSVLPSSQNDFANLFGEINKVGISPNTTFDYSDVNPFVKAGDSPTEIKSSYSAAELNAANAFSDYEYKKYKYQNQGTWDKLANSFFGGATAGLARAGENLAYLPQFFTQFFDPKHGVEGNFVSNWFNEKATQVTEDLMPIYMDPDKQGITDQDWNVMFFKGLQSLLDSTVGFAIPGGAIMKGLGTLGKASKLARVAARLGSIESESVVLNNFNKLMNTLASDANYQKAIHQGLGGLITNDIEGTAMAVQSYKENVASLKKARDEGRLDISWTDDKIEQFAADRAWDFKNTNRLLAIQDMWALGGIAKGLNSARGRLEKSTWSKFIDPFTDRSTAKKVLQNNFGEMGEEMLQSGLESEAKYQTDLITGDAKKSDKGYFGRILEGSTTKDAWFEGVIGFFGGGLQSMLTNSVDMIASKNYWDNQKKRLEDQNNFLNESSAKIKNDIKGLAGTQRRIEEHLKNGDDTAALVEQDMAFLNLASEHFRRGTTEHLERNIQSALQDPNISAEDKKSYQSLLEKLATYENIYNKYSGFANQQELFDNEVTQNANTRLLDALKMQRVTALEELRNGPLYGDKNWKNVSDNIDFWNPEKSKDLVSYFEAQDSTIKNSTQFQKLKSLNEKIQEGEDYLKGLKNENETLKSFKSNEFTKTKSSFLYNLYKKSDDRSETQWAENAKKELDVVAQQNELDKEEKDNISEEIDKMHQRAKLRKMFDLMEETRKQAEKKVQDETNKRNQAEQTGEQVDENTIGDPEMEINWDEFNPTDDFTEEDLDDVEEIEPKNPTEAEGPQDPNAPKIENLNEQDEKDAQTAKDKLIVETPPIEFVDNKIPADKITEIKSETENDFNPESIDEDVWGADESVGFEKIDETIDKPKSELDLGVDKNTVSEKPDTIKVSVSSINFRISKGKVVLDSNKRAKPVDDFDDGSLVQSSIDLMTMAKTKDFDILNEDFTISLSTYGVDKKQNIVVHHTRSNTRVGSISISKNPGLLEKLKNSPNNSLTTKMSSFYQALATKPTKDSPFIQLSKLNLSDTVIGVMTNEGLKLPDGQVVTSFNPQNKDGRVPIGSMFMRVNTPRKPIYLPLRYSTVGEVEGMNDAIIAAILNSDDVSNTIDIVSKLVRYMNVPSITVSSRKYTEVLKRKGEELYQKGKIGSFLFALKAGNGIPSSLGLVTIADNGNITISYSTKKNIETFKNAIRNAKFSNVMTSSKSKSFGGFIEWNGKEIPYTEYLTKIAKTNLTPISVNRRTKGGEIVKRDVFHIVQSPIFEIQLEPTVKPEPNGEPQKVIFGSDEDSRMARLQEKGITIFRQDGLYDILDSEDGIVGELIPTLEEALVRAEKILAQKESTAPTTQAVPTTTNIEGQVGTSNYSVIDGLIFYNNSDGTVTPIANPEGKPAIEVITDDIKKREQEELETNYKSLIGLLSEEDARRGDDRFSKEIKAKYKEELNSLKSTTQVESTTKEKPKKKLPSNFSKFKINKDNSLESLDPNDPLDSLMPYDIDDSEESNIGNYLIGNLTYLQQVTVVTDLINEISSIIAQEGSVNEAILKDKITESYINELDARNNNISELEDYNLDEFSEEDKLEILSALEDNKYAAEQLNNILDNFDTFLGVALDEIENSDLFNVEKDTEATQKEGNDSDPSFSEERHFTVNPKLQISKELKIFLHGIVKLDSDGNPYQNFLGKISYMSFNDVFNTIKAILADEENDFDTIIEVLTEASKTNPFLMSVVDKLNNEATEQIRNQFVSQMPSHLLNMKYVYISKNQSEESTNYRVSVADTNTNSIHLELESRWRNNQHLAPIFGNIKNGDYPINPQKLNRLRELLNTWNEEISSIDVLESFDKFYRETSYSNVYTPINHGEDNIFFLTNILSKHSESFVKTGEITLMTQSGPRSIRRIPSDSDKYYPKDYTGETDAAKSSAKFIIEDVGIPSFNEANVKEFFEIVGIELSKGTIEQITKKGFVNPKYRKGTEEKYYTGISGVFKDGTIIHHIKNAIANLDENSSLVRDGIELFTNNNSLKKLVKQEVMHNKNIGVNTFRSGEKAIYSYTAKKLITDRVDEVLSRSEYDILKQLPFNGTSLYLRYLHLKEEGQEFANENFREAFREIIHTDLNALAVNVGRGVNKTGKVNSLTEAELEAFMLGMYFNNHRDRDASKIVGEYRIAKYLFQTISDKSTGIVTTGLAKVYSFPRSSDPNKPLGAMVDDLYEWVFMPELKRLLAQVKLESSQDFRDDKYLSGASQFLILPELNTLEVEVEGRKFTLLEYLNMDPDVISAEDISLDVQNKVKEYLSDFLTLKVNEKMDRYKDEFIFKQNQYEEFRLIDTGVMNASRGFQGDYETKLRRMYFEYETNAIINYAENMKLFSGDPAMDYKGKVSAQRMTEGSNTYVKYVVKDANGKTKDATTKDFLDASEKTFAESTKRMAGMIAPGMRLANAVNNNYIQVYVNDYKKQSASIDYYKKLFKNDPKSLKAYSNIEAADAQEFTTWQEHLYVLNGLGKIALHQLGLTTADLTESKEILSTYKPGVKLTKAQKSLLNRVFQPLKPVVTGFEYSQANDTGKVLRPIYIKTSSFPLIPYLTQGLEIDKLRVAMENLQEKTGKTVRASFNTGNKRGLRAKSLDLYSDPNDLSKMKDGLEITDDTYLVLNRKNFRIQLEKPFKSEKKDSIDHIKRGTQPSKQLFSDEVLTTEIPFNIEGLENLFKRFSVYLPTDKKTPNNISLLTLYKKLFEEVYKQNRNDLLRELNIFIGLNGRLNYDSLNLTKLSELLQEELKTTGSAIRLQDKDALQINNAGLFNLDLSFSANSNKYEAALNALINNRVLKILIPGYSYNLGSELGFNSSNPDSKYVDQSSKEYKGIQDRIIWTSKYDGKSLQSANPKNGFKHQVIIPSKFRKEVSPGKWELIDLVKDGFVKEVEKEDGTKVLVLDESKFSPELLEIFGYRVPSSGMNTMASIEIAGFLPSESGDLAIATADFIVKMGSDFDADSLYSYMYYHKLNEEGKLVKDGEELDAESAQMNKELDKKYLVNSLIKIHHIVLTNPDEDIQRNASRPLGFDYASEAAKKLAALPKVKTGASYTSAIGTEYQKNQMIGAAAGKTGVGLFSLDVTSHAMFQQIVGNRKVRLRPGTEVKLFGFEGKELGRIYTLDKGRKISQVHEEYQNLALDSAKDLSLMNNLGVNDYTFSMFKAVNELGFDKVDVVIDGKTEKLPIGGLLANHPAVKAYIRDLKNNDSTSKENVKSPLRILEKHTGALSNLKTKDLLPIFEELNQQDFVTDIEEAKEQDFYNLGTMDEEDVDTLLSADEIERGRKIVALFNHFSNIGKTIAKIQGAFNTDSKMLDKSIFLNIERWTAYEELTDPESNKGSMFENINSLETSIGGYAATMGLRLSTELYKKVFPVIHNYAVRGAMDRILQIAGKEDYSMESRAKMKYNIYGEFKKFIYANSTIQNLGNTNLRTIRKTMFFDFFEDGKRKSESLASYVKGNLRSGKLPLQLFNSLEYSIFENEINPEIDLTEETGNTDDKRVLNQLKFHKSINQPSTISLNVNTKGEKINSLYLIFNEMLNDETPLPSWNGEEMTRQKLAQYLVLYSFLEGGVQEATQFTSLVPVKYLVDFGIARNIQTFLKTDSWGDKMAIDSFIQQYFQHNPNRAITLDEKFINNLTTKGSVFTNINISNPAEGFNIKLHPEKDSPDNYPEYVKMIKRNPENRINTSRRYYKVNTLLFQRNYNPDGSIDYLPVPIKGISGMNEFTSNIGEDNNSLIFRNQLGVKTRSRNTIAYGTIGSVVNDLLNKPKKDIVVSDKTYKGVAIPKKDFYKILNEIKDPILKKLISATVSNANLTDVNIYLLESSEYIAKAIPSQNVIAFSRGLFAKERIDIETAISEEYFHMLTATTIRNTPEYFAKVDNIRIRAISDFYERNQKNFANKNLTLENFINEVSNLNAKNTYSYVKSIMAPGTRPETITKLANILYSFSKVEEIAARGLVHKDTRDYLNKIKISGADRQGTKNESLFTILKNLIKDLFKSVFNIQEDSLLEDMISVIMEYQDNLLDAKSVVDPFLDLLENKLPTNPDIIFGSGSEVEKFLYETLGYLNKVDDLIATDEIIYTDEEGNLCAQDGFATPRFTEGGQWSIVKDLKGYPLHKDGGVDLTISKSGVKIKESETEFMAAKGLVMPFRKC